MADQDEPPNGPETEFLWAFGCKFPKSQLPRIPLDLEPPKTAFDPPDQLDDDYWQWSMFCKPKLVGWLEVEKLSKRLQNEADEEYAERQRNRPAAEIAKEKDRQERLRELVARPSENDDPGIWRQVDEFVARSGQGDPAR